MPVDVDDAAILPAQFDLMRNVVRNIRGVVGCKMDCRSANELAPQVQGSKDLLLANRLNRERAQDMLKARARRFRRLFTFR